MYNYWFADFKPSYLYNTMEKSFSQLPFSFEESPAPENADMRTDAASPSGNETNTQPEGSTTANTNTAGDISSTFSSTKEVQAPAPGKRGRRSLKDIGINADLINVPADEELFKKQYYSIGDVARMFRENQSLIRYWETEFDILQPRKNRKGDRFFRPVDIKNLVLIYDLLRRRKFTIEGAKDYLKNNRKAEEKFSMIQSLEKIKGFLLELKANL
jgi:DNA-binding transcriptional MerR regulator